MRRQVSGAVDFAIVVALAIVSIAIWQFLKTTDPQVDSAIGHGLDRDAFDSPYYAATWVLWPAVALALGLSRPSAARAFMCSVSIVLPLMVIVYIDGSVRWDTQDGATFWPIGELFLAIQGATIFVAGLAGTGLRNWRTRVRRGTVPPPWPLARRG